MTLLRAEPEQTFDVKDVVGGLSECEAARIERRWSPQPARFKHGDRLLAIPPAVYVADLLGQEVDRNAKKQDQPRVGVVRRGGSIYDLAAGV